MTLTLPTRKFEVTDHQKLNLNLNLQVNLNLNININLNLNLNQNLNWGSAQYSTSEKFITWIKTTITCMSMQQLVLVTFNMTVML